METSASKPAVEALYREHHYRLRNFILGRVEDESTADDILQEVFVRIHKKINTLRNSDRVQSWFYQIARNAIIDHYRSKRQFSELPETLPAPAASRGGEARRQIIDHLPAVIGDLPEPFRETLILSEVEGLSQKKVAERLGISYSTTKSRIQKGRELIRDLLLRYCTIEFDAQGCVVDCEHNCGSSEPFVE